MFTGIIEEMGTILEVAKGAHSAVLTITRERYLRMCISETALRSMVSV